MKQTYGDVWTTTMDDGTINIGLTNDFIQNKLDECFHILPADFYNVSENEPMIVVETNEGLESIKSPVSGQVIFFSALAKNFPDQIKEDDVIMKVRSGRQRLSEYMQSILSNSLSTNPMDMEFIETPVRFNFNDTELLNHRIDGLPDITTLADPV